MKQFKVSLWIDGQRTSIILGGANVANALVIARSMFKRHQVLSAVEVK